MKAAVRLRLSHVFPQVKAIFRIAEPGRTVCLMTTPEPEQDEIETPEPTPSDEGRRSRHEALLRAIPDLHEPRRLSTYLWGTQTVWFSGGGRADRRICQDDAVRFERVWAADEPPEPVSWHTGRWAAFQPERVTMVEWIRDCTYGTEYSPDDKLVLRDKGYDRGHLGALVDLWENVREPSYSPLVVEWLLRIVATDARSSHEVFTLLARTYEGESGAREGRRVWEEAGRGVPRLWTPTQGTRSAADDVDEQDDYEDDAVSDTDPADPDAESEDDGDGEEPGERSNDA